MKDMMEQQEVFSKHPHRPDCSGQLYRRQELVYIDRLGRIDNGGIIAHDYRCNMRWDACDARVLVTEKAVQQLAVAAEERKVKL